MTTTAAVTGKRAALVGAVAALTACGGGGGGDATTAPAAPVAARVVITTARPITLAAAGTVALSAQGQTASGAAVGGLTITWTSLDATLATVSGAGVVQAVGAGGGAARVVAAAAGVAGTDTLAVTVLPPVARVVVTTARPVTVQTGSTATLAAQARAVDGTVVPGAVVSWTSLDATVAAVSATGVVTGSAVGTARIVASAATTAAAGAPVVADTVPVAVVAPAATSVSLVDTLLYAGIAPGETGRLLATARDASGTATARPVTWTSSAPGVATVAADGSGNATVTGVAPGDATVTVTADAGRATRVVHVTTRPWRVDVTYDESGGTLSPALRAAVTAAVQRWQRLVGEASASGTAPGPLSGGACTLTGDQSALAASGHYRLDVRLGALAGGDEQGQATTTCTRTDNQSFAAAVVLDTSLARVVGPNPAGVAALVAHEIGHGLGIGSWRANGQYLADGLPRSAPTMFLGTVATAAWRALGQSGGVPIQQTAPGAAAHWSRPGGLCAELMSPSVGATSPISSVTLGALADLGWTVALDRAQPLTLQACTP